MNHVVASPVAPTEAESPCNTPLSVEIDNVDRSDGPQSILLADDDPVYRRAVSALLSQEGYEVIAVEDGHSVLTQLDRQVPDLLLLDVLMPGLNGIELCRRIKANESYQHVPIVLISARNGQADQARGFDAGADEFLTKPLRHIELCARVRSMMRIKKSYDDLAATLQMRQDLTNMVVHDMKNPLAAAQVYADLIRRKAAPTPSLTRTLADLRHQLKRLNDLADEILVLAKTEDSELALQREAVDLAAIVTAAVDEAMPLAEAASQALEVTLPTETRRLSLDPRLIRRVLDNLLSNAQKFTPAGGVIALRLAYPPPERGDDGEPTAVLEVRDDGPGVPTGYEERIFDKYETGPIGHAGVVQTGLGLAFCKLVVDAHGGHIRVHNQAPHGATFTLTL